MKYQETKRLHSPQIDKKQVFGVIQREPQPSMFDLLTWNTNRIQNLLPNKTLQKHQQTVFQPPIQCQPLIVKVDKLPKNEPIQNEIVQMPKPYSKPDKTKIQRPITANLYEYEQVIPVVKKKKNQEVSPSGANKIRPYSAQQRKSKCVNPDLKYLNKPPFAAYGRGNTNTNFDKLKSHNILPHSGKNKPCHNQTYESALLVASKNNPQSVSNIEDENNQSNIIHFQLPQQSRTRTVISSKNIKTFDNNQKNKNKNKNKNKRKLDQSEQRELNLLKKQNRKQPPLKFMNKRGDFIQVQREQEAKRNRLALKPTECYPGQYNVKSIDLARSHSTFAQPAGKKNPEHQQFRDLMVYPPYDRY